MALSDHNLLENGIQPAISCDRETALLLDGEINNAGELCYQFSSELGIYT
jgi:hypothetical protein